MKLRNNLLLFFLLIFSTFIKAQNNTILVGKEYTSSSISLTLFLDYLRKPQFIDIDFLVNTDFCI